MIKISGLEGWAPARFVEAAAPGTKSEGLLCAGWISAYLRFRLHGQGKATCAASTVDPLVGFDGA
ncbi:hypothetical protein FHT15_003377 [Xanthomonas campestris]|uniref:hypothetical protein n=1 Tax=Xanthomonas euroxanthea TaxID=2259622 RepID=UPI0011B020FF|nr:hypothetical protein [Xanthomonas euroxanthea]MBB3779156.1 hypothetical protein [Xanthomonas euroxanthea]